MWLPPRSLLLFTDEVYTDFLHGIQDVAEDEVDDSVVNWRQAAASCPGAAEAGIVRGCNALTAREHTRVSLTFRHVLKVRKVLMF